MATPSEIAAAEALLEEHYGDAVRPVSEVCRALQQWAMACRDNHPRLDIYSTNSQEHRTGSVARAYMPFLAMHASKSSLLGRLIYDREKFRTRKCPEHQGRWQGLEIHDNRCSHGCQLTGWLPEE